MPCNNTCLMGDICGDRYGGSQKPPCASQPVELSTTAPNPGIMQLADKLEKRAFRELKKDVGLGDHQWARGVLYAVNRLRSGQQHNA